jgi:hypothetical protein
MFEVHVKELWISLIGTGIFLLLISLLLEL